MANIGTNLNSTDDSLALSQNIVDVLREPLLFLDGELRIVFANQAFYSTFGLNGTQIAGTPLYQLENGQWDITQIREIVESVTDRHIQINEFELEHFFPVSVTRFSE